MFLIIQIELIHRQFGQLKQLHSKLVGSGRKTNVLTDDLKAQHSYHQKIVSILCHCAQLLLILNYRIWVLTFIGYHFLLSSRIKRSTQLFMICTCVRVLMEIKIQRINKSRSALLLSPAIVLYSQQEHQHEISWQFQSLIF